MLSSYFCYYVWDPMKKLVSQCVVMTDYFSILGLMNNLLKSFNLNSQIKLCHLPSDTGMSLACI